MAYSKQTWDTSSYVNPTRMNHIESGIEEVSNAIDNLDATHIPYDSNTSVKEKIDSPIDIKKTQSATAVLSVGGTMQLNSDIMGCKVIILTIGRYGYGDTKVFPVSRITDGAYSEGCVFWSDNAGAWILKISTTGLITYKAQVGGVGEPYIVVFGI